VPSTGEGVHECFHSARLNDFRSTWFTVVMRKGDPSGSWEMSAATLPRNKMNGQ